MPYTVAYCAPPVAGGTFSFYRQLRHGLEPLGARVFALALGAEGAGLWDAQFADGRCIRLAPDETDPRRVAEVLVPWLAENRVDILMPICDRFALSALPHLPEATAVVQRCCSITRHAYDLVSNRVEYLDRIVAISKRQQDDLAARRKIPQNRLALIPHGIDVRPYEEAAQARASDPGLIRIAWVNRLEHADKGCLYLAGLVKALESEGVPYSLEIAGDGPQRARLEARLAHRAPVMFRGAVPHARVAEVYGRADVFVLTSLFEGFPWSLLEAMSSGAVPVVSRISGVTDWIVRDGETGFVCPAGAMRAFASSIRRLHQDRGLLAAMSARVAADVRERFDTGRFAAAYHGLFLGVLANRLPRPAARPWSEFRLHPAFGANWRRIVPQPLKTLARRMGAIA